MVDTWLMMVYGFPEMGIPQKMDVLQRKIHLQMDEIPRGTPIFTDPPYAFGWQHSAKQKSCHINNAKDAWFVSCL